MKRTLSAIMAFALGICSTPGVSTPVAESDARSANLYYSMTMDEDGNWKEVPEYKPFKQSEENQDEVSFYPYTFKKDGSSETVASVRLQPLLMDNMYYGTSIDLGEGSGAVIASPVVIEVDMDFESSMLRAEVSSYDNKTELFSCCLLCPEDNASDKVKESEGPVEIKDGVTYYVLSKAYVAKDEPEEVTITDNGLTVNAYMEYYVSEAAINSFSKGDLLYFGMTSLDNNEQPSEMSDLLPVRYGMKALTKTDYAVVTTDNVPINTDLETEFTGSAVRPEVIVLGLEEPGVVLKKGEDYTASFSDNIHAGTARVTIAGVGDYYGNITAQFIVSPVTITANNTEVSFAEEEYVYSGVAVTPEMSVVYRGEAGNITLNKGTDYSQVYSNNTAPGQAVVTINGTGDFTGSVEARFTITAPPEVYTVSFDAGGGSGSMDNATVTEGEAYSLPECAFTKEGFEFETWDWGMPGDNVTITGNTTITAVWKQIPPEVYTVSFDANGGSGEMDSVTVTEGEVYTLPECGFDAPEGYKFKEWSYGDLIKFATPGTNVTITGNTTITALWKELPPEVYTVSFDANGGSGEMDSVTVTEGEVYTLPECGFDAPEGYKFKEWSYGDLIKFATPGTNVTITGNTTITAVWKQIPPEVYTVSFDANGGSGVMENVTVTEGEVYTLPKCGFDAPEGYIFRAWSYGDLNKSATPGTNVTITGNTTFEAKWTKKYIVPIDDNVNGTVTPLNITNISNSVFNSNITDITIRIDENISYFMGALIITNFTVQTENTTSVGSTAFSANVFNNTESSKLKDYMGLNPDTSKNETFNIFLDHSSSKVVGALEYNDNKSIMIYGNWYSRELPGIDNGTMFSLNPTNFTILNNTQARVYSGSTVVELTGEYLRTLEPGIYAIYFEFENGRAATLFAVENCTSVTPPPEEENGTGSESGNETGNNTGSGRGNETGNNTGSGSGNETGTESGTGNETETGNNTDSGNTGNERGENNAADTGSAGVIIYLMVAALLAGCVMSLSKGKKRRR